MRLCFLRHLYSSQVVGILPADVRRDGILQRPCRPAASSACYGQSSARPGTIPANRCFRNPVPHVRTLRYSTLAIIINMYLEVCFKGLPSGHSPRGPRKSHKRQCLRPAKSRPRRGLPRCTFAERNARCTSNVSLQLRMSAWTTDSAAGNRMRRVCLRECNAQTQSDYHVPHALPKRRACNLGLRESWHSNKYQKQMSSIE